MPKMIEIPAEKYSQLTAIVHRLDVAIEQSVDADFTHALTRIRNGQSSKRPTAQQALDALDRHKDRAKVKRWGWK